MQKTFKRVLAVGLSAVMAASAFSISAAAYNANYQSETHDVFRHTEQTLAPGVQYYNNYAYLKDGEQIVYYAAVADINRDDVLVQGGYWNEQTEQYGMAKLTEQVAAANAKFADPDSDEFISENYTVVAGTNGDFYNMQTGRPSGAFAINGKIMNNANNRPWFAIFEDNTALCGANDAEYNAAITEHGAVQNSVGGSQMLVVNGEDVTAESSGSYNTDRHSRTMIGVTADNKVVSVVLDGRQSPFSAGGSMHELAQIMLEADCVTAINLDGGGSTTFGARPEGEDNFKVINRPSDGSERSISSGVLIASLAAPSNVFERVSMKVSSEYVTPGTQTAVAVSGVSSSGASAEIPAEVTYDVTNGTFSNGVFTAGNAAGDAVITAMYNGKAVGSATVHVVIPDSVAFDQESFTIPYGKTVSLGITAKYGINKVTIKPADFNYTLETETGAGEIVDGAMVAPTEGAEATGNVVTATFIADNTKTTTANIAFGKASKVIFDFEDGTTQNWVRYNTANYNYIHTRGAASNVTAENGQVHSGDHALKLENKFSETWEAGYVSGRAGVSGLDEIIDLKGATRLGMWMYIPVADASFNGRIFLCKVTERDEETGNITKYDGYYTQTKIDTGGDWNCGFVTQFDEPGWHYIYFDLSTDTDWCIIKNATLLDYYINDRNGDSYGYNHLDYTNGNSDLNIYIDDVTVDYSSVVEDRERPIFSQIILGDDGPHSNEGLVLDRGSNYESDGYGRIDLSARVADDTTKTNFTGLNAETAKVYLDGVEFPCTFNNGIMTAPTKVYSNGKHTVKFSIEDNAGNLATAIRTFTVKNTAQDQSVWIEAKDPDVDKILFGSLYWVNVKAADAENVSTITMDLDLDNLSNWELDHMEVAQGFDAEYTIINTDENIAKLTITRNSDDIALLDGDAIVSMPIRTWELPAVEANYGHAGVVWMYDKYKKGNEVWPVNVILNVAAGQASFADNSTEIFTGDEINVRTESIYWDNDNAKASDPYYVSWNGGHDHRPAYKDYYAAGTTNYVEPRVTKEAKAPTCTEDGWTAELFCDECNSVVQWSEPIPATNHQNYELTPVKYIVNDGNGTQTVDLDYNGKTGVYPTSRDNDNKYGVDTFDTDTADNVITFTNSKDNGTPKFNGTPKVYFWAGNYKGAGDWPGTDMTYIGENDYGESQYTFEMPAATQLMVCADCGELCNSEVDGVLYKDGIPVQGFVDGKYYINGVAQNYTGVVKVEDFYYEFDENHVTQGKYTGMFDIDGVNYYARFGELASGWFDVDGDWYYFVPDTFEGANGVIKNASNVPQEFENGRLLAGVWEKTIGKYRYWFGPDYYHIVSRNVPYLIQEVEGDTYLFDEGGYRATGIVANHESNVQTLNWYDCGEDGKATKLTGPQILDVNGKLYYVDENGDSPANYGLVKLGDDYYYVIYDGSVKRNGDRTVTADKTNGLLPAGTYNFGEDGKMTNAPVQNGIDENGYYRENGEIVPGKGLVQIDGDYYYVIYNGKIKKDGDRTVTEELSNGLLPAGTYHFGPDGKMTTPINGIGEDGYYRENGVIIKDKGLIEVDGDYYYVIYNGKIKKDGDRTVSVEKANGLLPAGTYHFGEDGKMTNVPVMNGVGADGYYRENGEIVPGKGVVLYEGDFYYVIYNGKIKKDGDRTVTEEMSNGLVPAGTYHFGPDGKMTNPPELLIG